MTIDWKHLSREAKLRVQEGAIVISFPDMRSQKVLVDERTVGSPVIRIWSMVARAADLTDVEDPDRVAWNRNRESDLVGFKRDCRGRLFGEAWIPLESLTPEEWSLYVHSLARACDRFEYLITGRDTE